MSEKVTPFQIDGDVIMSIRDSHAHMDSLGAYNIIANTLAWISNNPPTPTKEVRDDIFVRDMNCDEDTYTFALREFFKVAFLKKEPELPQKLRMMLIGAGGQPADKDVAASWHNKCVIEAYKIGRGEAR